MRACTVQNVMSRNPASLLRTITLPVYQVLVTSAPMPHINEPLHRIGWRSLDESGRRRGGDPGLEAGAKGGLRVNPNYLSYPFPLPLPLSFARSRKSKGCPNSCFDRGVGLRGRGRYPLKPRIFASLLETKGYPEHTAARSSREYFRLK